MLLVQEVEYLERSNIMTHSKKIFDVILASSLRGIVDQANASGLTKEDIVQIIPTEGGFFLLYYKDEP